MEYIPAKTLVLRNKDTSWFGCDYTMNIYKGCCHGCIYCDSRSECYRIDNFDQVRAKENALQLIRDDLRRKVKKGVIGTGSMSDPYNPFEKNELLTRHALELINAYDFGVAIATKSDLIVRDIDILKDIKQHSPVLAKITITAADDTLCKKIEPNVALSSKRFEALNQLAGNGIFSGVLLMPVLPFLEDNEENILKIINTTADCGAKFIYPAFGMTMRQNQREWFYERLDESFPGVRKKYEKCYGNFYRCTSPNAKRLWPVFVAECEKRGLLYNMKDIVRAYKRGYSTTQLSLFE